MKSTKTLQREAGVLRKMNHKNVIKLLDCFLTQEHLYLIMELACGPSLFDALLNHSTGYSEEDARHIVKNILSALVYLHSHNIIHRDIKLENFVFANEDPGSDLKLVDFGFARSLQGSDDALSGMTPLVGTVGYKVNQRKVLLVTQKVFFFSFFFSCFCAKNLVGP